MEPRKGTRFGLTYLSEGDLKFKDKPNFSSLGPGMEAILRANGLLDAKIKIEFTMPQALMFSAYHDLNDRWAIMGNLGWQDWSEFGKVGVAVASEDTSSLTVDRNYKDTWHVAFGCPIPSGGPLAFDEMPFRNPRLIWPTSCKPGLLHFPRTCPHK